MKIFFSFIFLILLFASCSFQKPKNEWQYKSSYAYNSYVKNFLSSNELLALSDFNRALTYAKQSANLKQLAQLYLGKCSLNLSVGIEDNCVEYHDISSVVQSKKFDAYAAFLHGNIKSTQIELLPKGNQKFVNSLFNRDYKSANEEIVQMQRIESQLLGTALLKDKVEYKTLQAVLEKTSYYGYKKASLFLLELLKERSKDENEARFIEKKISILNTK